MVHDLLVPPGVYPQGAPGGVLCALLQGSASMAHVPAHAFDDAALLAAMRDYVAAGDALAAAGEDAEVLRCADRVSMAGLRLRKRLLELGWTAPAATRSPQ